MSQFRTLPERPNLEHLKAQAKDLLAAYRADDADARLRIHPYFSSENAVGLNEAQLVLAREYGFDSWARLKAHVEVKSAGPSITDRADRLAAQAVDGGPAETLVALLLEEPALSGATLAAACATGDSDALQRFLSADPSQVNAKIGPKGWEPLLYVCYSCLLRDGEYRPRLVATARLLLDQGADPNAHWLNADWDNCPEACLYGATGLNDSPEIAEMLLRAGADPNDVESLYHSTELPEPTCLFLLLDHGGKPESNNALAHLLDREEPEWLRRFFSYVTDPATIPPVLPHALRRGRSTEIFRLLIDSGMNLNARNNNGLTPYQSATRLGRVDVTDMLAAAGADTTLTEADTIIGRLARGESVDPASIPAEVIQLLDSEPAPELIYQAECGNAAVLEALLAAGANPNVRDAYDTPIHRPCLEGQLEIVRILLRHGADPSIRDTVYNGTALGWACHGSLHAPADSQATYAQIVEELLNAGAPLPEVAGGSPAVREILVKRGVKAA